MWGFWLHLRQLKCNVDLHRQYHDAALEKGEVPEWAIGRVDCVGKPPWPADPAQFVPHSLRLGRPTTRVEMFPLYGHSRDNSDHVTDRHQPVHVAEI